MMVHQEAAAAWKLVWLHPGLQQVIRIKKGREYPAFLPVLEEFY